MSLAEELRDFIARRYIQAESPWGKELLEIAAKVERLEAKNEDDDLLMRRRRG